MKFRIIIIAIMMAFVSLPTEAGIFGKRTKTGSQVAHRNAKNSVKAGKKNMRGLRKASRVFNQKQSR